MDKRYRVDKRHGVYLHVGNNLKRNLKIDKMEHTTILIAISVFLITTFICWKILSNYNKNQLGKKMAKQWNSKLYLWQGVIFSSTGLTFFIMFILKWTNVLAL